MNKSLKELHLFEICLTFFVTCKNHLTVTFDKFNMALLKKILLNPNFRIVVYMPRFVCLCSFCFHE